MNGLWVPEANLASARDEQGHLEHHRTQSPRRTPDRCRSRHARNPVLNPFPTVQKSGADGQSKRQPQWSGQAQLRVDVEAGVIVQPRSAAEPSHRRQVGKGPCDGRCSEKDPGDQIISKR